MGDTMYYIRAWQNITDLGTCHKDVLSGYFVGDAPPLIYRN